MNAVYAAFDPADLAEGEIYYRWRQETKRHVPKPGSNISRDRRSTDTLLATLKKTKPGELQRLLSHRNRAIVNALDELLPLPGLWRNFRLDHKWLSDNCPEQMISYLRRRLLGIWKEIFGDDIGCMNQLDAKSVAIVHLRAPGTSRKDREELEATYKTGALFSKIQEPARTRIVSRLLQIPVIIPSFYTFFEDVKYLRPAANIFKAILGGRVKNVSIKEAFKAIYHPSDYSEQSCQVQTAEHQFEDVSVGPGDAFEIAYLQVWLAVLRDCFSLGTECPRKEKRRNTPKPQTPNPSSQYQLDSLMERLGFRCGKEWLPHHDAVHAIDSLNFESDYKLCGDEEHERRCGRTFEIAHQNDRNYLYLNKLHRQLDGSQHHVTSFMVRACVVSAFFDIDCYKAVIHGDSLQSVANPWQDIFDCYRSTASTATSSPLFVYPSEVDQGGRLETIEELVEDSTEPIMRATPTLAEDSILVRRWIDGAFESENPHSEAESRNMVEDAAECGYGVYDGQLKILQAATFLDRIRNDAPKIINLISHHAGQIDLGREYGRVADGKSLSRDPT